MFVKAEACWDTVWALMINKFKYSSLDKKMIKSKGGAVLDQVGIVYNQTKKVKIGICSIQV